LTTVVERLLAADPGPLLAPSGDRRPALEQWLAAIGEDLERVAEAVNLTYFAHVPVQPVDVLSAGTPPGRDPGVAEP
jgi:hypothetical protein